MITSRVIGCGSGFIGPATIAFTQALNPRPAIRWGTRDRHGGWMGGKQRIAADAYHFFDIGLGFRRRRLCARLAKDLWQEGGVLFGHAASRQQRQGAGKHAHRDLHRRHGGKQPWSAGWTTGLLPNAAFFMSGQPAAQRGKPCVREGSATGSRTATALADRSR